MILPYLLLSLGGYLLGGVLFSYHLPKWLVHEDIVRESEDHNPGTANAFRYAGAPVGMVCLIADLVKGVLPVRAGMALLDMDSLLFALVMAAPVLGHATAPFYRIQGGKAIAVSFGVLLAMRPVSDALWILAGLYILLSVVTPIHPNERRTVVTFALFGAWALIFRGAVWPALTLGCVLIALIVVVKNYRDSGFPLPHFHRNGE